jgi:DNA-binding winged helix-turn-helix (wHTH) protein
MRPTELDNHWLYQCDGLVVDPRAHRLERDGQPRQVEPKAYTVLVALLEQAGNVVDKDTLLDAAWGHRNVTPGVLSHTISQLRHALGDSALLPRYIATVHTLGYRFVGDVHRWPHPSHVVTEPSPAGAFAEVEAAPANRFRPRLVAR